MKQIYILIIILVFGISCSSNVKDLKELEISEDPSQHQHQHQSDEMGHSHSTGVQEDGKLAYANFTLEIPDSWDTEAPDSDMRLIQLFPKSDKDIKIIGFYFGNMDNMAEANLNRWKNEFTEIEISEDKSVADGKVKFIEISGTYKLKPFPMAQEFKEEKGYTTYAAIISSNEGPYFFKVVAPSDKLKSEKSNFIKFISSYKSK